MSATAILQREHRIILGMLDAFEGILGQARVAHHIDRDDGLAFLDFFRDYADRVHHAKEEEHLFPRLAQAGIPVETGPVGVMLAEHERGRTHLARLAATLPAAAGGDPAARAHFIDVGLAYTVMLREHIAKEDHCLFPMADDALAAADVVELEEAYAATNAELADLADRGLEIARVFAERAAARRPAAARS